MSQASRVRVDHEQGATFVELFFDLVFVYAVTQLTAAVLHDLTWSGVGRAALLFWLVWWAWTQFTWTLNLADTEHTWVRLPTLAATAVAFFLAQAVPDAYTTSGAWFAVSYVLVRAIGLALQEWVYRGDTEQSSTLSTWLRSSTLGLALVLVGGFVDGDLRLWLWAAALVADVLAAARAGGGVWSLAAPHFAERHGLIVIIALGESLIAAGVATAEVERDALFLATTAGAVVATCALWWSYFGTLHGELEEQCAAQDRQRIGTFARDVYSLGHAVVVAGVIGIAVGFEEAIAHPDEALPGAAAAALTIGVAMFVGGLTLAGLRARARILTSARAGHVAIVLGATPLVPRLPAPVTLWGIAVLTILLATAETLSTTSPRQAALAR